MPNITQKRNLLHQYIPPSFSKVEKVNEKRVKKVNKIEPKKGDVAYIMTRDFRLEDNWGLQFAKEFSNNVKVFYYEDENLYNQIQKEYFKKHTSAFEKYDPKYEKHFGVVVSDFHPFKRPLSFNCAHYEVDSHNIIPARYISDKQEYQAANLRKKVYQNISEFLTLYSNVYKKNKTLDDFIENKLDDYDEFRNNPNKNVLSNLSKDLHFGFISSQRVALEVLKSNASRENKETFLEELIIRKELSDNFCLYSKDYKSLCSTSNWALKTIDEHRKDKREPVYSLEQLKKSKTHDELWNAAQNELMNKNKIHSYMRMYWAKKIFEWSKTPEDALINAIYLNDNYSIDGLDPNGYVGILWSIAGLHDRAFMERKISGKIRSMSLKGTSLRFDINEYIKSNS